MVDYGDEGSWSHAQDQLSHRMLLVETANEGSRIDNHSHPCKTPNAPS
jgi:hypothetical protein